MRALFASAAMTVALSFIGCGGGGAPGKKCEEYFKKVEDYCKDAKNKESCDDPKTGLKSTVAELKKAPNEDACEISSGLLDLGKDLQKSVDDALKNMPADPGAGSAPAAPADGGAAGSAPAAPAEAPK